MKQNVVNALAIGVGIAIVSLLFFYKVGPKEDSVSSSVERKDSGTGNTIGKPPSRSPVEDHGISGPSLSPAVPPRSRAPKDDSHRRAEAAKTRADLAAARTIAIFSKLAKYGTALNYSLAALQAEAAYPPGYKPGSDYHIEEARAARVEAKATELEAMLTRQMQQ
jgi:hypothetical protein